MSFSVLGIGTAVPQATLDQAHAIRVARNICCRTPEQAGWLAPLYAHSGVTKRHIALGPDVVRDMVEGTHHSGSPFLPSGADDDAGPTTAQRMRHYAELAPPLAIEASRRALEQAGLGPRSLTHLVTVSCTGFFAPGLDRELIEALRLPATIERTHVGYMGCHGALNGLRVARAFTGAEESARALVCAVELCSLHYHYRWEPKRMVANILFADGAGAAVGCAPAVAPSAAWRVAATGSCLVPGSADAMTWHIGDHGFEMMLTRQVPALIGQHLRPWLQAWLDRQGLSVEGVASWAVHPGGPRVLEVVEQSLGLPAGATACSREVLAECGNMSSATILFILDRLRARAAPLPCVALAFGPGMVAEAVLFRD